MIEEKRHTTLTDEDVEKIVERLTLPENIDKFAANFEHRWRDYFYKGLGKGIVGWAQRGLLYGIMVLAGYGMSKYKFFD